jgi:hypothetical protein
MYTECGFPFYGYNHGSTEARHAKILMDIDYKQINKIVFVC